MTERQRQKSAVSVSTPDERRNIVPAASAQYPRGREESSLGNEGVDAYDWAQSRSAVAAAREKKIYFQPSRDRRFKYRRIQQEEEDSDEDEEDEKEGGEVEDAFEVDDEESDADEGYAADDGPEF